MPDFAQAAMRSQSLGSLTPVTAEQVRRTQIHAARYALTTEDPEVTLRGLLDILGLDEESQSRAA